jgi:hypothetical protein
MMAAAAAAALALCGVAQADFFAVGGPNGWDIGGGSSAMVEGPAGVWTYNYSVAPNQRDEFNIVATAGDWGSQLHGSNQFSFADGAGNGSISLDTNAYADGWSPSTNRIGISGGAGLSWTATGGFLGALGGTDWDNASPQGAMAWNGSYFSLTVNLPDGTYDWKPVVTGSWDSIGNGNSNSVNGDNGQFTTGGGNNIVILDADPARGVLRATVIPAPAAMSVLGAAGLLGLRRRRN